MLAGSVIEFNRDYVSFNPEPEATERRRIQLQLRVARSTCHNSHAHASLWACHTLRFGSATRLCRPNRLLGIGI